MKQKQGGERSNGSAHFTHRFDIFLLFVRDFWACILPCEKKLKAVTAPARLLCCYYYYTTFLNLKISIFPNYRDLFAIKLIQEQHHRNSWQQLSYSITTPEGEIFCKARNTLTFALRWCLSFPFLHYPNIISLASEAILTYNSALSVPPVQLPSSVTKSNYTRLTSCYSSNKCRTLQERWVGHALRKRSSVNKCSISCLAANK